MKLLLLLALLLGGFLAWNYRLGKTKRANNAYPDNWSQLSASQQREYLAALDRAGSASGYE